MTVAAEFLPDWVFPSLELRPPMRLIGKNKTGNRMMFLCGVWAIRVGLDLRFPEGTNFPIWKLLVSGNHFCPGLQGGSQLELAEIGKTAFTNHLPNQKNICQEIGESKQLQTEGICICLDPNWYFSESCPYCCLTKLQVNFLPDQGWVYFFPCTPSLPVLWPLLYLGKEQKGTL